jgi:hypothetical protein
VSTRDRLAAVVLDRDLALGVGAQALDHILAADLRVPLDQTVGQLNRQRHQLRGLAAGEAEHHALVARASRSTPSAMSGDCFLIEVSTAHDS